MNIPKKIKQHLINFFRVTGFYIAVTAGITVYQILTNIIAADTGWINTIQTVATILYFLAAAWFCWRFYTGVYRDGDFLE
jgi:hypothetical protein